MKGSVPAQIEPQHGCIQASMCSKATARTTQDMQTGCTGVHCALSSSASAWSLSCMSRPAAHYNHCVTASHCMQAMR
jgi:hypothetical protein